MAEYTEKDATDKQDTVAIFSLGGLLLLGLSAAIAALPSKRSVRLLAVLSMLISAFGGGLLGVVLDEHNWEVENQKKKTK